MRVKTELPPSESGCAFRRNLDDLPPFVRAFYSAHRRFPTTEEALEWLKDNGRYSGEWEDGFNRRARRVGQILRFLSGTSIRKCCPRVAIHRFLYTVVVSLVGSAEVRLPDDGKGRTSADPKS